MPPPYGGIKQCRDPSIRPFVCLSHVGQLGAQRLGQATRAVRTADPSAHDNLLRHMAAHTNVEITNYMCHTRPTLKLNLSTIRSLMSPVKTTFDLY